MTLQQFILSVNDPFSQQQFLEMELRVVTEASNLISQVVFPSEITQYTLFSIGITNVDSTVLQFVHNLCKHEIWQNGYGISYIVLAFTAVFIFYEQMGDIQNVTQLLEFLNKFERENVALTPEIAVVREKLIRDAVRLTSCPDLISRLRAMLMYDFYTLIQHVRDMEVAPVVQNLAHNPQNLEPVHLH